MLLTLDCGYYSNQGWHDLIERLNQLDLNLIFSTHEKIKQIHLKKSRPSVV